MSTFCSTERKKTPADWRRTIELCTYIKFEKIRSCWLDNNKKKSCVFVVLRKTIVYHRTQHENKIYTVSGIRFNSIRFVFVSAWMVLTKQLGLLISAVCVWVFSFWRHECKYRITTVGMCLCIQLKVCSVGAQNRALSMVQNSYLRSHWKGFFLFM